MILHFTSIPPESGKLRCGPRMRLKGSLRHGGGAGKGGMTRTDVRRLLVPNAPEPSPEAVAQPPSSPRTHGFDALRAAKRRFGSPGSIGRRIPGWRRNATWDYASPMLGKERRARSKAAEDCQTGDFAAHRLANPCSEASPRQPKERGWARTARQKERGRAEVNELRPGSWTRKIKVAMLLRTGSGIPPGSVLSV